MDMNDMKLHLITWNDMRPVTNDKYWHLMKVEGTVVTPSCFELKLDPPGQSDNE
jgi:hypothetical protein